MSRKTNRKCKMCGTKVKPGVNLCPSCQAWDDAGKKPVFNLPKEALNHKPRRPVSDVGQAIDEIFGGRRLT